MATCVLISWPKHWISSVTYHEKITRWCDANFGEAWDWKWDPAMKTRILATHICFDNPEDATLFALTFAI